ncbi:hypothetical protein Tco_1299165 [Tanacetum coccineum]
MGRDRKRKGKANRKQKVTCIKEVDDLEERINNLKEFFSNLRNMKLKQKEMRVGTYDNTSSSEALINFLSARDLKWQFPMHTQEEQPKPLYVPVKTEKEKPLLLDIGYPHLDVGSRTRVTNTRGKAHYGLRSLGPLQEEIVHVKKPYNMVKVTKAVLGLTAQKTGVGCFGSIQK